MKTGVKAAVSIPVKVDPELVRQLDGATASSKPVEAVIRLKSDDPSRSVPHPDTTEDLARKILARVSEESGGEPSKVTVFRNFGSFFVEARPRFLEHLLKQPELAAATANRQPDIEPVPPMHSRPATLDDIGAEATKEQCRTETKTTGRRRTKSS